MLYVLYIYPFFDLLSVYVYIAIKVELLYYIYIITIVKKRILQLQLSLKNFFFFQSRCQCVLLTHFRYVAFAVCEKISRDAISIDMEFHQNYVQLMMISCEKVILCIFQMLQYDM